MLLFVQGKAGAERYVFLDDPRAVQLYHIAFERLDATSYVGRRLRRRRCLISGFEPGRVPISCTHWCYRS